MKEPELRNLIEFKVNSENEKDFYKLYLDSSMESLISVLPIGILICVFRRDFRVNVK